MSKLERYKDKPEKWTEEMWALYQKNASRYPTDNDNPSLNRFVEHFCEMCDRAKVELTLTFDQMGELFNAHCSMCDLPPRVGNRAIVRGHVWPHNYIGRKDCIRGGFTPENSVTKCRFCLQGDLEKVRIARQP